MASFRNIAEKLPLISFFVGEKSSGSELQTRLAKQELAQHRSQWENHGAPGPAAGREHLNCSSLCWEVHIPLRPAARRKSTPGKHQELGFSLTLKCKPASLFNFICISKLCGQGGWEAASPSTGAVFLAVSGVPPWSQMVFHACSA